MVSSSASPRRGAADLPALLATPQHRARSRSESRSLRNSLSVQQPPGGMLRAFTILWSNSVGGRSKTSSAKGLPGPSRSYRKESSFRGPVPVGLWSFPALSAVESAPGKDVSLSKSSSNGLGSAVSVACARPAPQLMPPTQLMPLDGADGGRAAGRAAAPPPSCAAALRSAATVPSTTSRASRQSMWRRERQEWRESCARVCATRARCAVRFCFSRLRSIADLTFSDASLPASLREASSASRLSSLSLYRLCSAAVMSAWATSSAHAASVERKVSSGPPMDLAVLRAAERASRRPHSSASSMGPAPSTRLMPPSSSSWWAFNRDSSAAVTASA
mmetsp:Transcript_76537/g.216404  ORF Transcript_76537/g.216404 Transcript_76537/m.216404 type:complete len:333 (-) Transcript_76537:220-1218(-)